MPAAGSPRRIRQSPSPIRARVATLASHFERAREVAPEHGRYRVQGKEQPLLGAFADALEDPSRAGEPAAGGSHVAAGEHPESEPERAAGGWRRVAPRQVLLVSPRPQVRAVGVLSDQVRRHGEPIEVLGLEVVLSIGGRELRVRVGPVLPTVRLPALIECFSHRHRRSRFWERISL